MESVKKSCLDFNIHLIKKSWFHVDNKTGCEIYQEKSKSFGNKQNQLWDLSIPKIVVCMLKQNQLRNWEFLRAFKQNFLFKQKKKTQTVGFKRTWAVRFKRTFKKIENKLCSCEIFKKNVVETKIAIFIIFG